MNQTFSLLERHTYNRAVSSIFTFFLPDELCPRFAQAWRWPFHGIHLLWTAFTITITCIRIRIHTTITIKHQRFFLTTQPTTKQPTTSSSINSTASHWILTSYTEYSKLHWILTSYIHYTQATLTLADFIQPTQFAITLHWDFPGLTNR